jgi:hypothetical protein
MMPEYEESVGLPTAVAGTWRTRRTILCLLPGYEESVRLTSAVAGLVKPCILSSGVAEMWGKREMTFCSSHDMTRDQRLSSDYARI